MLIARLASEAALATLPLAPTVKEESKLKIDNQMPDNAAIYIADPALLRSNLFDSLDGIRSYEGLSEGETATAVRFKLEAAEVTMNFMPSHQNPRHLEGFSGFAGHVIKDRERLLYVLSRIRNVRLVLGCVVEPGFDEGGKVGDFLFAFNGQLNGLLFIYDTIFDYDGEALGGQLC